MESALIQEFDQQTASCRNESGHTTESDEVLLIPPVPVVQPIQNGTVDEWQFITLAIATTGCNIHTDDIVKLQLVPFKTTLM